MIAAAEMKSLKAYVESAGFEVSMLKDGSLEVKDPYHLNGKANAGFEIVVLRTPRAVNKFIRERS